MIKLFQISILVIVLLFSCKKVDDKINSVPVTEVRQVDFAGDNVWDLLGYGYDATGEYARTISAKAKVIDPVLLKAYDDERVIPDFSTNQYNLTVTSSNALDFSNNLTFKVADTVTVKLFKGSITSSFSNANSFSTKYIYGTYYRQIQKKRLRFNSPKELLMNYLTPTFLNDLQNQPASYIVANYGTHVLSDIILGGRLEIVYQAETTNSNKSLAAETGLSLGVQDVFGYSTGLSINQSISNNNSFEKLVYKAWGGNNSIAISGQIDLSNGTNPTLNANNWQASITPENSVLIDFGGGQNSLIPLYELVADPFKKEALRAYILQYQIDNQVKLRNPIYRYYNPGLTDHLYMIESYPGGYQGYNYENIEFQVPSMLSSFAGTTQINGYWNNSKRDHYYEKGSPRSIPGYVYEGIKFKAFATQQPGTVPVYQYYHPNIVNHFYTTVNQNYSGYIYEGIAFYAFPAN